MTIRPVRTTGKRFTQAMHQRSKHAKFPSSYSSVKEIELRQADSWKLKEKMPEDRNKTSCYTYGHRVVDILDEQQGIPHLVYFSLDLDYHQPLTNEFQIFFYSQVLLPSFLQERSGAKQECITVYDIRIAKSMSIVSFNIYHHYSLKEGFLNCGPEPLKTVVNKWEKMAISPSLSSPGSKYQGFPLKALVFTAMVSAGTLF